MRRFYTLLALVFFSTQIMAQNLSINGTVSDENGNAVIQHAVHLYSADTGFYSNVVYTNENGDFSDLVEFGDITQGEIFASTESCNSVITQSQFFNPGNYELTFNFEICVDTSGGGGNDTTTNCQNDFNYQYDGLNVYVNGWEVNGNEVELYFWSFGDGTSAEGQNATHEYASEGEYVITLTTTGVDDCEASSSQLIDLSTGNDDAYLWGQIYIGNSTLDLGIANLYTISTDTVGEDDIVLYAQAQVDSAGTFYFNEVPDGNYLILAQADENSTFYNSTLPTYYGDVIYWVDAAIIILGEPTNPYYIQLQAATGANSGEGQINGDLVGDDMKSLLIDGQVSLFLLDENDNPLEIAYSEENESFDFSDIAFGNYVVYAEVIGLLTEPANVTLDAENPVSDIEIHITPNGVTTAIDENYADITSISDLFPNPVDSYARLNLNLLENAQVEMVIINQLGQVINHTSEYMNQGINKIELNTQSYPSGVYFLQIKTPKSTLNQKFIKN